MVQPEEIRREFVNRLKQALAKSGIAEWGAGSRLAEITKKTPKAASKWLNGEAMPGRANMQAIAEELHVRIQWLQYGEGEMHQNSSEQAYQSDRVAVGKAIFDRATPRSQAVINQIVALEAQGKLTGEDLLVLEQIIKRFSAKK